MQNVAATKKQEVNEKRPKPRNSPSHNHDNTAPRQHLLIYTGAGPIRPVHGPLRSPSTEAIAHKDSHFRHFGGVINWIIRVGAGLIKFVYGSLSQLGHGAHPSKNSIFVIFRASFFDLHHALVRYLIS